jgi:hypothetical protein
VKLPGRPEREAIASHKTVLAKNLTVRTTGAIVVCVFEN